MAKQAVLMVNLGSPDSTDVADVRRYLHEFLTDERVIDKPFVRKVIVPGIILRTRPAKSAEAYASIWTDQGSPLMVTSWRQLERVREALPGLTIELAMRYGNPSIASAIAKLKQAGVTDLYLMPLYPHYAMSSYETVVVKVDEEIALQQANMRVSCLQPFYQDPDYIEALTAASAAYLEQPFDKVLFSYHGVPERHLRVSDPSHAHCLCVKDCCQRTSPSHATCYRHQCYKTTELLVKRWGLREDQYFVSFQSRLGRDPWLTPYTDETVERFAREGVKKLLVMCPAFVTDCLETLEEIAEEAGEIFEEHGGEKLTLIPCLNEHPAWIQFMVDRIASWRNS